MAWIRIKDEVIRLERAWDQEMAALEPALRVAGLGVLEKMDLGRGRARSWPRLFAPWTSLYPLLQAEGLDAADLHQATRLNLAHLALLVHAFIDDRKRDGQLHLAETEARFGSRCFELAMERLNDELPDIFPSNSGVRELLDEYETAQSARWPASPEAPRALTSAEDSGIRRVARGRAIHGYLAPLALILGAGVPPGQARRLRQAYDELDTGLQWGDDAEDWEADWLAGRQNLLLFRLAHRAPETAAMPPASRRLPLMREVLHEHGIFDEAVDAAVQCFEAAASIHASTGGFTLAGMMRMLSVKVERLRGEGLRSGAGGR